MWLSLFHAENLTTEPIEASGQTTLSLLRHIQQSMSTSRSIGWTELLAKPVVWVLALTRGSGRHVWLTGTMDWSPSARRMGFTLSWTPWRGSWPRAHAIGVRIDLLARQASLSVDVDTLIIDW
jgi:hypothetical protein